MSGAQTAGDRRDYLESGLTELDCWRCRAHVRVRKNSAEHTSIQWTADAQRRCRAFDARLGCPDLRRGIDDAVEAGRLHVGEG